MSDTTSSQHLDHKVSDRLQAIAAEIFDRYGVNSATAQRAGGWTNVVWLTDELVLRLSTTRESQNLLREARLAAMFPAGVGYPKILEAGMIDGCAWSLATRLPGESLGEAWASLRWEERVTALSGLWERAQAVHAIPATVQAATWPPCCLADRMRHDLSRRRALGRETVDGPQQACYPHTGGLAV